MDLQWEYNNVRIKKGDEWKVAFTTPEESFKLTVMFFRLMNSLATFQTIINEILQNLINTGKVVSFINNIIIGMDREKGHDKLVEEVVKKLVENDLYVKPEKCKQKMKEVEVLGVIIRPEGIKIEKEKVKRVLDWLTPKCIKDIQNFLGLANYYH